MIGLFRKNPTSIHLLFWVAVAKYKQGKLETSLELFENLAAIYPTFKNAEDAIIQEKFSSIAPRLPIDYIKEQYKLRLFDKGEIDFYLERIKQELMPKQPILENRKM